jgi:hypothetical protein
MTGKDIEKASVDYQMSTRPMAIGGDTFDDMVYRMNINPSFISGAEWVLNNLWKPADGEDLPEIDKEVIALIETFGHYKVIFAHRVDENAEIHTSINGKPLVLHPKKHDKGGWNIPDIKWWLDLELPKIEE